MALIWPTPATNPIIKATCWNISHWRRSLQLKGSTVCTSPPLKWFLCRVERTCMNQTHHISFPPAPARPHSVLAVLLIGLNSWKAHSQPLQNVGGTAPGWWTSSGSWWSSSASSLSVDARSSGHNSLLREALHTTLALMQLFYRAHS